MEDRWSFFCATGELTRTWGDAAHWRAAVVGLAGGCLKLLVCVRNIFPSHQHEFTNSIVYEARCTRRGAPRCGSLFFGASEIDLLNRMHDDVTTSTSTRSSCLSPPSASCCSSETRTTARFCQPRSPVRCRCAHATRRARHMPHATCRARTRVRGGGWGFFLPFCFSSGLCVSPVVMYSNEFPSFV